MAISKKYRLQTHGFKAVFKLGKRFYAKGFTLIYLNQNNLNQNNKSQLFQCGISIRKKDYKTAVARNKIKRQIYQSYFENFIQKNNNLNGQYIILVKKHLDPKNLKYIRSQCEYLWSQLKLKGQLK